MPINDPLELRQYRNEHARLRRHLTDGLADVRRALEALETALEKEGGHEDRFATQSEHLTAAAGRVAVAAGGYSALQHLSTLVTDNSEENPDGH